MKKREEKLKEKMQLPTKNNNSLMHNDFQQDNKIICIKIKENATKKKNMKQRRL